MYTSSCGDRQLVGLLPMDTLYAAAVRTTVIARRRDDQLQRTNVSIGDTWDRDCRIAINEKNKKGAKPLSGKYMMAPNQGRYAHGREHALWIGANLMNEDREDSSSSCSTQQKPAWSIPAEVPLTPKITGSIPLVRELMLIDMVSACVSKGIPAAQTPQRIGLPTSVADEVVPFATIRHSVVYVKRI